MSLELKFFGGLKITIIRLVLITLPNNQFDSSANKRKFLSWGSFLVFFFAYGEEKSDVRGGKNGDCVMCW